MSRTALTILFVCLFIGFSLAVAAAQEESLLLISGSDTTQKDQGDQTRQALDKLFLGPLAEPIGSYVNRYTGETEPPHISHHIRHIAHKKVHHRIARVPHKKQVQTPVRSLVAALTPERKTSVAAKQESKVTLHAIGTTAVVATLQKQLKQAKADVVHKHSLVAAKDASLAEQDTLIIALREQLDRVKARVTRAENRETTSNNTNTASEVARLKSILMARDKQVLDLHQGLVQAQSAERDQKQANAALRIKSPNSGDSESPSLTDTKGKTPPPGNGGLIDFTNPRATGLMIVVLTILLISLGANVVQSWNHGGVVKQMYRLIRKDGPPGYWERKHQYENNLTLSNSRAQQDSRQISVSGVAPFGDEFNDILEKGGIKVVPLSGLKEPKIPIT